jgi:hypothetical protein
MLKLEELQVALAHDEARRTKQPTHPAFDSSLVLRCITDAITALQAAEIAVRDCKPPQVDVAMAKLNAARDGAALAHRALAHPTECPLCAGCVTNTCRQASCACACD